MGKAEAKILDDVYQVARQQADAEIARLKEEIEAVREESQAMGVLKKIEYDLAHNQMLKYVVLHRIKQAKEYRKGGLTWFEFCEAIGEPQRTADRILAELAPVMETVSAKLADFTGMDFSKIRLLGRSVSANLAEISEDGMVLIGDERIPLAPDYRDDLQAALERVIETNAKVLADKEATIRAKDKVLQDKQKLVERQAKELARYEAEAEKKGLLPAEDAFLKKIGTYKTTFDGLISFLAPDISPLPEDATERMKAAYLEALGYMRRQIEAAHDTAVDCYSTAVFDNDWVPPFEREPGEALAEARAKKPGRKG